MSVAVIAVIAVCGFAGASVSLIRQYIPNSIRLIVQIVIIASFVAIIDQVLKAYALETSKALSVYVFLIVTNCIVLGRVESFAMSHDVWPSFLDGIVNGLGYSLLLLIVASIRELPGAGALLGRSGLDKYFPRLYAAWGVFLPLITVNCAILGGTLFTVERAYTMPESLVYGFGSGVGWAVAVVALAGIREKLRYSDIPAGLQGTGITFVIMGLMAMGFMGFSGIQL